MSETLVCQDVHLDRKVLVKTLQPNEEARRLVDEQKALLRLRSRHVVQLLDLIEISGSPGLVLEFIEGNDLSVGALPVDMDYVRTLWQIAAGLSDIHAQGVVHRDIKPNNIRRDLNGIIKIIDFGLSRTMGADAKTRSAIGALPFIAPEFMSRGTVAFTTSVDVYAFAMTALSLATPGIPQWSLAGPGNPPPNNAVQVHLPTLEPSIAAVIQSCLAGVPSQRPPIAAVRDALERLLLFNQHRARISLMGSVYEINGARTVSTPTVTVGGKAVCSIRIEYDGNWFNVGAVTGSVLLNNIAATAGMALPRACVVEFQYAERRQVYATFDVSNPKVMF